MNIMIIAAEFAPSTMVGAKRPTELASQFCKLGHSVLVVSLDPRCMQRIDNSTAPSEELGLSLIRQRCHSLSQHMQEWRSIKSPIKKSVCFPLKVLSALSSRLTLPDELLPWVRASLPRSVDAVKEKEIDVIWATIPSLSSALLAKEIHRVSGVPYVVDYRDILDPDDNCRRMNSIREIERGVLRSAGGVSFTTQSQAAFLSEEYPWLVETPMYFAPNFFDTRPKSQTIPRRKEDFIVYGGSLYGGQRRIDGVLSALSEFNSSRTKVCKLRFFGLPSDIGKLRTIAKDSRVLAYLQTDPMLSQQEFNEYCRRASIQLLIVGQGRKHTYAIPAKLFDYLKARRPILVVAPENCEAGELVTDLNCGLFALADDTKSITKAIRLLLEEKNWSGKPLTFESEKLQTFDGNSVAKGLVEFFQEVCGHRDLEIDMRSVKP